MSPLSLLLVLILAKMKTLQSFVLLLFFTICHNVTTGVYSQCLKDQQLSLLYLKKNLTFDEGGDHSIGYPPVSSKFVSWDSSTDCCSWVGVTCSSNGRPKHLGGIDSSSSLFDLQHLQSLNLADNSFVEGSRIPSAIGKLTNLRYLNLSSNDYFGKIPFEISRLTRLEVLDISQSYSNAGLMPLESPNHHTNPSVVHHTLSLLC
ncbi:hypothetical protein DVH24_014787 [Malus domestica]|uniref:Leucine-rich repeat-containing N-terminal plant-type domain-containing protein n=1 Tax=Malus domestica TaxID=3750 RepID=A0A498K296_MALDO|nr:hypothetical protein DVH24_014787 [Malus domestica]